jgi:hypothetical protein
MSRLRALPVPAAIHVGALLVACVGFMVLVAAGAPDVPPIPPGVVLFLVVAAATVYWAGSRWPPLVGALNCAVILVGAFLFYPGTLDRLADPGSVALFLGTVVQIGGVAVAAVSGFTAALVRRPRATSTR